VPAGTPGPEIAVPAANAVVDGAPDDSVSVEVVVEPMTAKVPATLAAALGVQGSVPVMVFDDELGDWFGLTT